MNCEPGDLALIVGSSISNDPDLGKIVKVITAIPGHGEPCWGVECSVPLLVSFPSGEMGLAPDATIADRHLRPIRGAHGNRLGAARDRRRGQPVVHQ